MRSVFWISLVTVLGPVAVWGQTPREVLQTFAGRQLILFHRSGEDNIKLQKDQLSRHSGACDVAVEVNTAEWKDGKVAFLLRNIGTPHIAHGPGNSCPRVTVRIALEISGFASDEHADTLADSIRQVLKTPEEYLAANGVQFDLPAGAENQELTKSSGPLDHPEVLMSVDGAYTEEARKKRLSGAVTMKVVVGSDGRIHDARISQGMGSGLDENALQVIRMWRFKPAMQGGRPMARPATIAMNFKIY